jgi:hypothetical protein
MLQRRSNYLLFMTAKISFSAIFRDHIRVDGVWLSKNESEKHSDG